MISGGSSAQRSIAQYGQEGSEEIQRRGLAERGVRWKGVPPARGTGGLTGPPHRLGLVPCPAQLPRLFGQRDASSPSCHAACVDGGDIWGCWDGCQQCGRGQGTHTGPDARPMLLTPGLSTSQGFSPQAQPFPGILASCSPHRG